MCKSYGLNWEIIAYSPYLDLNALYTCTMYCTCSSGISVTKNDACNDRVNKYDFLSKTQNDWERKTQRKK